jgi:hypothetical protein
MCHTQATTPSKTQDGLHAGATRFIAAAVAGITTLAIGLGIHALAGYEASRADTQAAIATTTATQQRDVITIIGKRHHHSDAAGHAELAESAIPQEKSVRLE